MCRGRVSGGAHTSLSPFFLESAPRSAPSAGDGIDVAGALLTSRLSRLPTDVADGIRVHFGFTGQSMGLERDLEMLRVAREATRALMKK